MYPCRGQGQLYFRGQRLWQDWPESETVQGPSGLREQTRPEPERSVPEHSARPEPERSVQGLSVSAVRKKQPVSVPRETVQAGTVRQEPERSVPESSGPAVLKKQPV